MPMWRLEVVGKGQILLAATSLLPSIAFKRWRSISFLIICIDRNDTLNMQLIFVISFTSIQITWSSNLGSQIRLIFSRADKGMYNFYLLLVTSYLVIKLLVTDNFSACRKNLAENRLSFPSAPHCVWHSYLSKGLRLIPYTCGSSSRHDPVLS